VRLADKAIKLPFYLFQSTIGAVFTTQSETKIPNAHILQKPENIPTQKKK
jgi:hypothetical protein